MKYKPVDVADGFDDKTLSCGKCNEPIYFPLIRNPQHIYDKRPTHCKMCGAEIDWKKEGESDEIS